MSLDPCLRLLGAEGHKLPDAEPVETDVGLKIPVQICLFPSFVFCSTVIGLVAVSFFNMPFNMTI